MKTADVELPDAGKSSRSSLGSLFGIGDAKKGNRLSVLSTLSLADRDGSHWRLSGRGRVVANVLNALIWSAAIEKRG